MLSAFDEIEFHLMFLLRSYAPETVFCSFGCVMWKSQYFPADFPQLANLNG